MSADNGANQGVYMNRRQALTTLGGLVATVLTNACQTTSGGRNFGQDLDTYGRYAVGQGSREAGASLELALKSAGMAGKGLMGVFTVGYNDQGQPFIQMISRIH